MAFFKATAVVLVLQLAAAFTALRRRHQLDRRPFLSRLPIALFDPTSSHVVEETLADQLGARIAAAFSPHHVELADIESVSIVTIDEFHVDLCAMVCEDGGCVSVFCPIEFPSACSSCDDERCILEQLQVLNDRAQDILEARDDGIDLLQKEMQERHDLMSLDNLAFPDWWAYSTELKDECQHLMKVVNGPDFEPEVQAMAETFETDLGVVQKAVVVDMCPAGLVVRAKVYEDELYRTVGVPFAAIADSVDTLRALFLQTIDEAGSPPVVPVQEEAEDIVLIQDEAYVEDDDCFGIDDDWVMSACKNDESDSEVGVDLTNANSGEADVAADLAVLDDGGEFDDKHSIVVGCGWRR